MKKSTITTKTSKRIVCFILTVAMMLSAANLPVSASSGIDIESDLFWSDVAAKELVLKDIVAGEKLYDVWLYSDTMYALKILIATDDAFRVLTPDMSTLFALSSVIPHVENDDKRCILCDWYQALYNNLSDEIAQLGLDEISPFELDKPDGTYTPYTVSTPSGKTLTGLKYAGGVHGKPNTEYPSVSDYSSARFVRTGSFYYNCFSHAWYLNRVYNSRTLLAFNDHTAFSQFICNTNSPDSSKCFAAISRSSLRVGDIVVYQDYCGIYPGEITHSAVVTAISGNQVTVESKWGWYGVYTHTMEDCPYYRNSSDTQTHLTYYRVSHSFRDTNNGYVCYNCGAHAY